MLPPLPISVENIIQSDMICAYSERNKRTKPLPPYSILKPDTNSLSPSDKSNGARLVSASSTIMNAIDTNAKNSIEFCCEWISK